MAWWKASRNWPWCEMPRKNNTTLPPEVTALLARYGHEVGELALRLRDLVLRRIPRATERVYAGWRVFMYGLPEYPKVTQQICYIGLSKAYVTLGFHQGKLLPDPDGLLSGTGKTMRHVRIIDAAQISLPGLPGLLDAAVSYGQDHHS